MNKETPTAGCITCSIPPELQDHIDNIATKLPREAAKSGDLDDSKQRWLVIGICLHSVLSPEMRKYVDSILTAFYNELIRYYKIDTQIYPTHLKRDPQTGAYLNYEAVNTNKANYGNNISKYDYTIKNAVDLSKLFLKTHMAHYTGFDRTCDSSALLGLILNIAKFDPVIKSDADDVRTNIRNAWAHCDFTEWDAVKFSNSFLLMNKLVKDLKLSPNEETLIIEELDKWEMNGQRFLSGTTHGLELLNEFRQQTHLLAVYVILVATETDSNFMKIRNELTKLEAIFDNLTQLDEDMKKGFSAVEKRFVAQDKALEKTNAQIDELKENLSKCERHDSHKKKHENIITACLLGYYDTVKYFISKGVDLDQGDQYFTPLTAACLEGNEEIVQLLIAKGVDVNQVCGIGETPMIAACKKRKKSLELLTDNAYEKILQILIDNGSDVNQINDFQETPLTVSCLTEHKQMVQLLIDNGSDVNQRGGFGQTPITAVCENGNERILKLLTDNGGDVNQVGMFQETPLTAACRSGNEKIVQLLIDKGSDVNQVSGSKATPLTAACGSGHEKLVQLLIDKGGDINQIDGNVDTPLTSACRRNVVNVVELLLDNGGDANKVDGMLETPLIAASKIGNEKMVQLLIDKGCYINQPVYHMVPTPLTAACIEGHEQVVELLINSGGDLNQVDGTGETPLTTALTAKNTNIIQLLIAKGCDLI